jgi:ATP synthase protein I
MSNARKPWREFGRYGAVGMEFVVSMAVGYYLGKWLDGRFFGGKGWATGIGSLIGVYTAFKAIYTASKRMTKDIERAERQERGEDPWDQEANDDEASDDDNDPKDREDKDGR